MSDGLIKLPVQFVDAGNSAKALANKVKAIQNELKNGTSSFKLFEQGEKEIDSLIRKANAIQMKDVVSQKDVQTLEAIYSRITKIGDSLQAKFSSINFKDLNITPAMSAGFATEIANIQRLDNEIVTLNNDIKNLQKQKVSDTFANFPSLEAQLTSLNGLLTSGDQIDFKKGFSDLDGVLDGLKTKFSTTFSTAEGKVTAAQTAIATLNADLAKLGTPAEESARVTAKQAAETAKEGSVLNWQDRLEKQLDSQNINGESLQTRINRWVGQLTKNYFDKSTGQLDTTKNGDIENLFAVIYGVTPVQAQREISTILNALAAGDKQSDALRSALKAKLSTRGADEASIKASIRSSVPVADAVNKVKADVATDIANDKNAISGRIATEQANEAAAVGEKSDAQRILSSIAAAEAQRLAVDNSLQAQITAIESSISLKKGEIQTETGKIISGTATDLNAVNANMKNAATGIKSNMGNINQAFKTTEAIDSFASRIKYLSSRLFSLYTVFRYVRMGINSMKNDIKNLDAAMTNISVVTNMTNKDLWEDINSYMSKASTYGVSTQSVYEVAQLYYQQGLNKAQVNSLTGETLKLSRISGMGSTDASNGMTVAIRAFNMEMSEASRVTDVYSKVASISASSSKELIEAMSKTASAAANVGASFENTTAMIATMVEATRESAVNIGSAMKSIIARYGEMKAGNSKDEDGEYVDYNKTDTALKSIGISIKDSQGQFRDFDDVIEELASKWDSLDSVSQRYIATVMAGNRQQSRFIALVSNYSRYMEISKAATDSADAGLVQYSKTLDSIESKMNQLSTSFQQFYMSIFNGTAFSGILDTFKNLLESIRKKGTFSALFDVAGILAGAKTIVSSLLSIVSTGLGKLKTLLATNAVKGLGFNEVLGSEYSEASFNRIDNKLKAKYYAQAGYTTNYTDGMYLSDEEKQTIYSTAYADQQKKIAKSQQRRQMAGLGLALGGMVASSIGASLNNSQDEGTRTAGKVLSAGGNILSMAGAGMSIGGGWGALAGAVAGVATSLPGLINGLNANTLAQEKLEAATKDAEQKNIERAKAKTEYTNLNSMIEKIKELSKTKNLSEENYEEWISANESLVEAYPSLLAYYDAEGNAIANVTSAMEYLQVSADKAATATAEYYKAEKIRLQTEMTTASNKNYANWNGYGTLWEDLTFKDLRANLFSNKLATYNLLPSVSDKFKAEDIYTMFSKLQSFDSSLQKYSNISEWLIDLQNVYASQNAFEKAYKNGSDSEKLQYLLFRTMKDGTSAFSGSSWGGYTMDSSYINWENAYNSLRQLNDAESASAQATLAIKSSQKTSDDSLEGITGYNKIIEIFMNKKGITDSQIGEWSQNAETTYQDVVTEYGSALARVPILYRDEFEKLLDNLGNYNRSTFSKALIKFGITQDTELYNAYMDYWLQQSYLTEYQILDFLNAKNGGAGDSLEKYLQDKQTDWENKNGKSWNTYISNADSQAEAQNLIDEWTQKWYEKIQDISLLEQWQKALIQNYGLDQQQSVVQTLSKLNKSSLSTKSESMRSSLNTRRNILQEVLANSDFLKLSDTIRGELLTSLLKFIESGSSEDYESFKSLSSSLGVNLSVFNNVINGIYENITAKIDNLVDTIDDIVKEGETALKSSAEGFTVENAKKLYQEYNKIAGNNTKTWAELFKINEEGKLVIQSVNDAINAYLQPELKQIQELRNKVNTDLKNFNEQKIVNNVTAKRWAAIEKVNSDYLAAMEEYTFDSNEYKALASKHLAFESAAQQTLLNGFNINAILNSTDYDQGLATSLLTIGFESSYGMDSQIAEGLAQYIYNNKGTASWFDKDKGGINLQQAVQEYAEQLGQELDVSTQYLMKNFKYQGVKQHFTQLASEMQTSLSTATDNLIDGFNVSALAEVAALSDDFNFYDENGNATFNAKKYIKSNLGAEYKQIFDSAGNMLVSYAQGVLNGTYSINVAYKEQVWQAASKKINQATTTAVSLVTKTSFGIDEILSYYNTYYKYLDNVLSPEQFLDTYYVSLGNGNYAYKNDIDKEAFISAMAEATGASKQALMNQFDETQQNFVTSLEESASKIAISSTTVSQMQTLRTQLGLSADLAIANTVKGRFEQAIEWLSTAEASKVNIGTSLDTLLSNVTDEFKTKVSEFSQKQISGFTQAEIQAFNEAYGTNYQGNYDSDLNAYILSSKDFTEALTMLGQTYYDYMTALGVDATEAQRYVNDLLADYSDDYNFNQYKTNNSITKNTSAKNFVNGLTLENLKTAARDNGTHINWDDFDSVKSQFGIIVDNFGNIIIEDYSKFLSFLNTLNGTVAEELKKIYYQKQSSAQEMINKLFTSESFTESDIEDLYTNYLYGVYDSLDDVRALFQKDSITGNITLRPGKAKEISEKIAARYGLGSIGEWYYSNLLVAVEDNQTNGYSDLKISDVSYDTINEIQKAFGVALNEKIATTAAGRFKQAIAILNKAKGNGNTNAQAALTTVVAQTIDDYVSEISNWEQKQITGFTQEEMDSISTLLGKDSENLFSYNNTEGIWTITNLTGTAQSYLNAYFGYLKEANLITEQQEKYLIKQTNGMLNAVSLATYKKGTEIASAMNGFVGNLNIDNLSTLFEKTNKVIPDFKQWITENSSKWGMVVTDTGDIIVEDWIAFYQQLEQLNSEAAKQAYDEIRAQVYSTYQTLAKLYTQDSYEETDLQSLWQAIDPNIDYEEFLNKYTSYDGFGKYNLNNEGIKKAAEARARLWKVLGGSDEELQLIEQISSEEEIASRLDSSVKAGLSGLKSSELLTNYKSLGKAIGDLGIQAVYALNPFTNLMEFTKEAKEQLISSGQLTTSQISQIIDQQSTDLKALNIGEEITTASSKNEVSAALFRLGYTQEQIGTILSDGIVNYYELLEDGAKLYKTEYNTEGKLIVRELKSGKEFVDLMSENGIKLATQFESMLMTPNTILTKINEAFPDEQFSISDLDYESFGAFTKAIESWKNIFSSFLGGTGTVEQANQLVNAFNNAGLEQSFHFLQGAEGLSLAREELFAAIDSLQTEDIYIYNAVIEDLASAPEKLGLDSVVEIYERIKKTEEEIIKAEREGNSDKEKSLKNQLSIYKQIAASRVFSDDTSFWNVTGGNTLSNAEKNASEFYSSYGKINRNIVGEGADRDDAVSFFSWMKNYDPESIEELVSISGKSWEEIVSAMDVAGKRGEKVTLETLGITNEQLYKDWSDKWADIIEGRAHEVTQRAEEISSAAQKARDAADNATLYKDYSSAGAKQQDYIKAFTNAYNATTNKPITFEINGKSFELAQSNLNDMAEAYVEQFGGSTEDFYSYLYTFIQSEMPEYLENGVENFAAERYLRGTTADQTKQVSDAVSATTSAIETGNSYLAQIALNTLAALKGGYSELTIEHVRGIYDSLTNGMTEEQINKLAEENTLIGQLIKFVKNNTGNPWKLPPSEEPPEEVTPLGSINDIDGSGTKPQVQNAQQLDLGSMNVGELNVTGEEVPAPSPTTPTATTPTVTTTSPVVAPPLQPDVQPTSNSEVTSATPTILFVLTTPIKRIVRPATVEEDIPPMPPGVPERPTSDELPELPTLETPPIRPEQPALPTPPTPPTVVSVTVAEGEETKNAQILSAIQTWWDEDGKLFDNEEEILDINQSNEYKIALRDEYTNLLGSLIDAFDANDTEKIIEYYNKMAEISELYKNADYADYIPAYDAISKAFQNSTNPEVTLSNIANGTYNGGDIEITDKVKEFAGYLLENDSALEIFKSGLGTADSSSIELGGSFDDLATKTGKLSQIFGAIEGAGGNSASGDAEYSGNINSIGSALAEGNTKAKLSGKTLVGELGPEMAVYNGKYHLLGQNGAEFVNLPSNAIVFNHEQTAGIINGQWGYRGTALAGGNVEGPARAFNGGGHSIYPDSSSSSSSPKAARDLGDLEKWFNLSKMIANSEKEINILLAERDLIINGDEYADNLHEQNTLLQQQLIWQQQLNEYKQADLERLRAEIEAEKNLSSIIGFRENGQIQYRIGNELLDGEGMLQELQRFKNMSTADQDAYLKEKGYYYVDTNGHSLSGDDLAKKFFEEVQKSISEYDTLFNEVLDGQESALKIQKQIKEIEEEFKKNQEELEKQIYDIIVDQMKQQIEELKDQKEIIKDSNDKYTDALSDALNKEKDMYSQQKSTADREALQRQLSLLRRSGGSALEIANLENQLNDSFQNEYFDHQQESIDSIKEANEKQVEALERQIQLQEDALEYQEKNGVIWNKVYEVLSGDMPSILDFMRGNATDFFSKSALQQANALDVDWAKKIGIYVQDREWTDTYNAALKSLEDDDYVLGDEVLRKYLPGWAEVNDENRAAVRKVYASAYADEIAAGETAEQAKEIAARKIKDQLSGSQYGTDQNDTQTDISGSGSGGSNTYYSVSLTCKPSNVFGTATFTTASGGNKVQYGDSVSVTATPAAGYKIASITAGGTSCVLDGNSATFVWSKRENLNIVVTFRNKLYRIVKDNTILKDNLSLTEANQNFKNYSGADLVQFATGGETGNSEGLAYLHKKERILSAEQTEAFNQLVNTLTSNNPILEFARNYSASMNGSTLGLGQSQDNSINIAAGAVQINVESLSSEYDVNSLANDVMDKIYNIAAKSNSRGVTRR